MSAMDDFYGMHGPHGPHWGWGPGVFGLLAPLLFSLLWLAPLLLLLWYARHAALSHVAGGAPAPQVETPSSAVEALRQRYVRGEIDFDTFERMLSDLSAGNHAPPPLADDADEAAEGAAEEEQAPPRFRPRPDIPVDWS